MFVTNHAFTISVIIPKTSDFALYNELAELDLLIKLPNDTIAYDDNITGYGGATYVTPVTAAVNGLLTFSYTPTTKGLHQISITTGTSSSYTVLGTTVIAVVDPTTTRTMLTKLP